MNQVLPMTDERQQRAEAAIDWLLRLTERPEDDELLSQWLAWCAEHPDNLDEFRRSCDLWNAFDEKQLQALLALPLAVARPQPVVVVAVPDTRQSRRRLSRLVLAAAVLAVVSVSAVLLRLQLPEQDGVLLVTQVAQHSSDMLEDGSRMDIGAGSRVLSHYSEKAREVELEKGEAFFEVAKDPGRPFVVHAGEISARAVGTAFNVRTGVSRTVVTVSHGLVEVLATRWFDISQPSDARRALAGPGEQVVYDKNSGRLKVEQVDTEVVTSWRQGLQTFRFVNEPLADVAAYLNRYAERKIIIRDSALARRTFTGTVHHDRSDDWLLALEQAYPLRVQRLADGETVELVPARQAVAGDR